MNTQGNRHLAALFLCAAAAALLNAMPLFAADAASLASDEQWELLKTAARARVRRILYENDGDDCLAYPENLEPSVEGYLAQRTSFLNKYPVDTVFYTPTEAGFGHVSLDIEHADPLVNQPYDFNPADRRKNIFPYLKSIGTDTLVEQLKYARANGLELFCDVRMNDVHDAADRPGKPHLLFSAYKRNHPEYLFSTWDNPPPYGHWSSLDYDHPEVREYFLAHVTDIARKYPVDGISFDFHRQPRLFRSVALGAVATDEQREHITELFRRVRQITEEAGRAHGRPQLVAIRIPDSVGFCRDMGFDLEKILAEGLVDIVICGGNFRLNPWSYSKELCDRYGVKMYPSIDMPQFTRDYSYRLSRHAAMSYYARLAAAFQAGAEGCYYFNLFNEGSCKTIMRPDMDSIRLESKRYHLTDRWLERQVLHLRTAAQYENLPHLHSEAPIRIEPEKPQTFPLEFGDDIAALKADEQQVVVRGIIKSSTLRDNAVQVTSNGRRWRFLNHDDQFLYYSIPDGALLPGLNRLVLEAGAATGDDAAGMVTIMSGKEQLLGSSQGPWRRLWDRTRNEEAERIVDGAYCLSDLGEGMANFFYPLTSWDADILLDFDFKLGDSSDDRCVGIRLANGRHYEALFLGKESIRLEIAGAEAPFKTTDGFHNFRIRIIGDEILVEADGRQLLSAQLTADVGDTRAAYAGSAYADGRMHEKGLVLGALSDKGTSVSYWKNVRLQMPAGAAVIQDLAVEVLISRRIPPSQVDVWESTSPEPCSALSCGDHAYSRDHLAVEADFAQMPADGTKLLLSNGGTYFSAVFNAGTLSGPDGRSVLLPQPPFTIRGEESGELSLIGVVGGGCIETIHMFVSQSLDSGIFDALASEEKAIMRRSGIVLLPPAGTDAPAMAAQIRSAWVKPLIPVPSFSPVVVYDPADGMPSSPWKSSYDQRNISIAEDGMLHLENEHPKMRWQAISLTDAEQLKALGKKAVLLSRFSLDKDPAPPAKEFYTLLLARLDDDGEHEAVIRIARNHIETNFGQKVASIDAGRSHEIAVELDFAANHARLWLDGELLLEGDAAPDPTRKEGCLMFGDGSGSCGGAVIVESFRTGPVE